MKWLLGSLRLHHCNDVGGRHACGLKHGGGSSRDDRRRSGNDRVVVMREGGDCRWRGGGCLRKQLLRAHLRNLHGLKCQAGPDHQPNDHTEGDQPLDGLWMFIFSLFVPFHVLLTPTFLIIRDLNWIDTWPGLVLPM